tara:strand:+ start:330 stop:6212 length:5883 start_codon:yes stop_codon:yes gene_type:complete
MAVACIVLIGWLAGIEVMTSALPGLPTTKFNTALCFALSSFVLMGGARGFSNRLSELLRKTSAFVILCVAVATLLEYLLDIDLFIDQLFISDPRSLESNNAPGRMSAATAIAFLFLALAQVSLFAKSTQSTLLSQTFAVVTFLCGLIGLTGYIYSRESLFSFYLFSSMALPTTILFQFLSLGVLWLKPHQGFMAALTKSQVGVRLMLPSLLPIAVIGIILLSWLILYGEQRGLYDTAIGATLFGTANIITVILVSWWLARNLYQIHEKLESQNTKIKESGDALKNSRQQLENAMSAANMASYEYDLVNDRMKLNDRFYHLYETTVKQVGGYELPIERFMTEFCHPEDVEKFRQELSSVQTSPDFSQVLELDFRFLNNVTAEVRDFLAYYQLVRGESGNAVKALGALQDVTVRKLAEGKQRQQRDMQEVISMAAAGLLAAPSSQIDSAIDTALKNCGVQLGVDRTYLFQYSEDKQTISTTHEWCEKGISAQKMNVQDLPVESVPWWAKQMEAQVTISIPEVSALPEEASAEKAIFSEQEILSLVAIPLKAKSRIHSFVGCDAVHSKRDWTSFEINQLRIVGELISSTLERDRAEQALRILAESTASTSGESFFESSVSGLARSMGAKIAMVAVEREDNPGYASTLAYWEQGQIAANLSFQLKNSPCENVLNLKSVCVYADKVTELFPDDQWLQAKGIQSYIGIPLMDSKANVLGHLALMDSKPLSNTGEVETFLRIFADRISGEMSRRQADDALRESETGLRVTLNSTRDGIVAVNNNGYISFANVYFYNICGLQASGDQPIINGQYWVDLILPNLQDMQSFQVAVDSLKNSSEISDHVLTFRNGKVFECHSEPLFENRLLIGRVWSFHDITIRVKMEEELKENRIQLEEVMNLAAMGAWQFDVKTALFTWNDRFFAQLGTSIDDEGSYQMTEDNYLKKFCHPDDRARISEEISSIMSSPQGAKVSSLEYRVIRKDNNQVRDVIVSYQRAFDSDGDPVLALGALQDITERKRIERELASLNLELEQRVEERTAALGEQQAIAQVMLENLSEGVVACDVDGKITLFNKTAREWHNCDPSELPQEQWPTFYNLFDVDGETLLDHKNIPLIRALSGEHVRNVEMCIVTQGAHIRHVSSSGGPILDKDGNLVGAIVAMYDMTAILESERFASASLDALGAHVAILDQNGVILATNRAWKAFGQESDLRLENALEGTNYLAACDSSVGAYARTGPLMADGIRSLINGERHDFLIEYPCHSAAAQRWFLCGVTRFPGTGPVRIAVAHEEITAIKQSQMAAEQALSTLDATRDGAFIYDADTLNFSYVNQGAMSQLGYSRNELLAMTPVEIMPEFDDAAFRELLRPFRSGDVSVQQFTTVHRHKDGHDIPVDINLQYITSENTPPRFVALVRDITERKQAQDAIVALNDELEIRIEERTAQLAEALKAADTANRAKSAFLANRSHEIRTPLNTIAGMVELLEHTSEKDEQEKMLRVTQESVHALAGIIDDVLDFSKIEAGMLEVRPEPMSIKQIVDSVTVMFSSSASAKNLNLIQVFDEKIPVAVLCDPLRLKQILFNLLGNAIKFTEQGKIELRVSLLEQQTSDDAEIEFEVVDTGVGISPEAQTKLFKPFVQAESDTTRMFGGTGLGLAISRRLAELLGGDLSLKSKLGKGTTMTLALSLPVLDESSLGDALNSEIRLYPSLEGKERVRKDNRKLLIVDDNAINRQVLNRQLRILGYEADNASNGREALKKWTSGNYALVLADCHMPIMDGYKLASSIRAIEAKNSPPLRVPIIGYTANALQDSREHCLQAGMDDVLIKPVGLEPLRKKLYDWLEFVEIDTAESNQTSYKISEAKKNEHIDWECLGDITGNDHAFARDMLTDFLLDKSEEAHTFAALLEGGSLDEIQRLAHRMKGAASTVAALKLSGICSKIESAAIDGDKSVVASSKESFIQAFEELKLVIENIE